jgi:hypothetical protein
MRTRALLVSIVAALALLAPGTGAMAQECADDDYSTSCQAQRNCENLARRIPLVYCTQ